ncbi:MAG: ACT domain-containing protein [Candidatus Omnitrophica bacterium]|nr:ACT domain-containing protein [Candidatus Omnitrophota bacterium]MDD4940416.1 ACT domain-containing protein [Candidatus Omnitrophota bacterium]MDD5775048.1 ACT domain-containing protein [Candidatus Omnitrophota bacterium]HNQ49870.1 ACT domain-containing protein [Candidatus Omnitrophota bacterium]
MARELNIFVENRPGRLRSVAEVLSQNRINVRTMTLADRGEFGLMKMIVDKPQEALLALQDKGFACAIKDILAIALKDKPGSFLKLADLLYTHKVNVLDAYGFVIESSKQAVFCVEVKDPSAIKKILQKKGFDLLEDELHEF